jgi:hypothetical protein
MEMKAQTFSFTHKLALLVAAILLFGGVAFYSLPHTHTRVNPVPAKTYSVVSHNIVLGFSFGGNNAIKPLSLPASDTAAMDARDAQRISDLTQLQNDIQLYYKKCGYYPGVAQPWEFLWSIRLHPWLRAFLGGSDRKRFGYPERSNRSADK